VAIGAFSTPEFHDPFGVMSGIDIWSVSGVPTACLIDPDARPRQWNRRAIFGNPPGFCMAAHF